MRKWKCVSICGNKITEVSVNQTRKTRIRKLTPEETEALRIYDERENKLENELNRVYFQFVRRIFNEKLSGYEAMQVAEELCKKYPKRTQYVHCDDSSCMNSALVLIDHCNSVEYWGTTLLILPQDGVPSEVFLYPSDMGPLQIAINRICMKTEELNGNPEVVAKRPKWPFD